MLALIASEPGTLIPRADSHSMLVLLLITICVTLVALARARERKLFVYLLGGVSGFQSLEDLSDDFYKTRSFSSWLSTLVFVLASAGSVYWIFFLREPLVLWQELLLPVLLPAVYVYYLFFISNTVAFIAGETQVLRETNYFTLLLTHAVGFLLLLELIISYFQPEIVLESTWVFGSTYALLLLLRIVRGIFLTVRAGVSWYYIILYFWTLEILPLLIISKLLFAR